MNETSAWDQKWEPSVNIRKIFQTSCPENPGVIVAFLYVAPGKKTEMLQGREETLTTTSAGSTLGVSESCTATWHPHPEARLL